jgi:hypothetical protein
VVDAGVVTDEELYWFGGAPAWLPESFIDAPRLARMPEEHREVALETAMWMLRAAGALEWDPDRNGVELRGPGPLLAAIRTGATCVVTARFDSARGHEPMTGEPLRAVIFEVAPEVYLAELVLPEGLHQLAFLELRRAAAWLAGLVDAGGHARRTGTARRASSEAELAPSPDTLSADAVAQSLVTCHQRHRPLVLQFFGGSLGLHLVRGWHGDGRPQVTQQELSAEDLTSLLAELLVLARDQVT